MRLGALSLVVVLQLLAVLLGAHSVTAGYAPCSDPATCGAVNNCCTTYNGVNYCCPGSGNSLDINTMQCASFAQCGQSALSQLPLAPSLPLLCAMSSD